MKNRRFLSGLYLVLVALFLYLPIGTLMVLSFNSGKSMSSWQGFSLKWYQEMFSNQEIMHALGNTFTIALWSASIATVIGVLACIALNRMNERKRNFFLGLNNIPMLNADIVTGISIMMMFIMFGISLNYGTVLFSHITFCIPYVILSVMPKFRQLQNMTYEAALDLGATPVYAFFKIVLPDLMPGILSGFMLSFTMSVDDFVITHFTRGAGIDTLSTLIYSQLKVGVRPTMYAISTVIFIIVLLILVVSNVLTSDKVKKKKKDDYKVSARFTGRRLFASTAVFVILMGLCVYYTVSVGKTDSGSSTVYVYNFGDYIDPDLVSEFEEETGYSVVMDYFDTNEEMYPVIKNKTADYDVICASDYMIEKMIGENLLEPIDFRNVPNAEYLTSGIRSVVEDFDPGMKYCIPHTWGTYGIAYNKSLIDDETLRLMESGEISWKILWDKKYEGQIVMTNSLREAYMVAAEILGYSINTTDEKQVSEMTDLLIEQKPLVYAYANDNCRDLMIGGSAALGVITSGDVLYARDANSDIGYAVPVEGTEVWTDCWAVPASVGNREGAYAWLDFLLSKEAAEKNFEYIQYAIPNTQLPDFSGDPVLSPSESVLAKCETLKNLGTEGDDLYSRYWKKAKDNK